MALIDILSRPNDSDPLPCVAEMREKLWRTKNLFQSGILFDEHAERGLIGCLLEGGRNIPERFDPVWIADDGRRALFLAFDIMQAEGMLYRPDNCSTLACRENGLGNAETIAFAVRGSDLWKRAEDPRCELVRCLDEVTQDRPLNYYVSRLQIAWLRRKPVSEGGRA